MLRDGCLVHTCESGTVVESLAQECVDLIDKIANKIIDEKLAERGENLKSIILHNLYSFWIKVLNVHLKVNHHKKLVNTKFLV